MNLIKHSILFATVAMAAVTSRATLLDFEDQTSGALGNYHGITFDAYWGTWAGYTPYTPYSGSIVALTNQAGDSYGEGPGPATFTFNAGTAVFDGAYFAGYGDASGPITFSLYHGGTLVSTSGSLIPTGTPTWLSSDYSGLVDTVEVNGYRGYYVVDDLTYHTTNNNPVPEPSTYGLFGSLAILGLAAWRRYRR